MILLQLQILGEMVLAMLLGGAIGFDREEADKPAGLRTHMLVAGSAALLTGLGGLLIPQVGIDNSLITTDPLRTMQAVITGISFLGAGTIIRHRGNNKVEGLTTAASLLFAGALGISVALRQYVLAIGATAAVLLTLRALKHIDI
ncbi:MAG: MgtC/SapB family protein [Ardenticatenaceae bacterium]|nr:MgtC/SapB family protein [Ardenticatenaceae bacterium]